jgi:hypothetical protein
MAMRDAGTSKTDEGPLRANAARLLVQQLKAKGTVYGHETTAAPGGKGEPQRSEGWWWNETEFDCSKFVLWVMAGRNIGDPGPDPRESTAKAIRDVRGKSFGTVSDASSVAAMIEIVRRLAKDGMAQDIDQTREPHVGDLMFWTGHVGIVVDVKPAEGGDLWVVYANMGTKGAGLVGVDDKGHYWLKRTKVKDRHELAAGDFLGYWAP